MVQISSPHGLGPNQVLNYALEESVILEATRGARQGGIEVFFTPNGSLEALDLKDRRRSILIVFGAFGGRGNGGRRMHLRPDDIVGVHLRTRH